MIIKIAIVLSCIISLILMPFFTSGRKMMDKIDFILICTMLTPILGIPIFFCTHKK